jgi:hypothetical protein
LVQSEVLLKAFSQPELYHHLISSITTTALYRKNGYYVIDLWCYWYNKH